MFSTGEVTIFARIKNKQETKPGMCVCVNCQGEEMKDTCKGR